MTERLSYDVAIIGGGPAGSTLGSLIRKYNSDLKVTIIEKERFPREHVGESQLPPIGAILDEMGCWDEVEAAGFPIKIGVTYRWGKTSQLWDFDFVPPEEFEDEPRPAPYAGNRKRTALQVDRAKYDKILLRHAEKLGCHVMEGVAVETIERNGDEIERLVLNNQTEVTAKWYIDASGQHGILRRAMEVSIDTPSHLKNIAIWNYWDNAKWADEIGIGGTRVQVLSQPHGWLWFIPLGPTRTSIGLICPVDYYKNCGKTPQELYDQALVDDERVRDLIVGATPTGELETISDWSFLAERTVGKNWMLIGEAAGFADPILAAGMTLAQGGGRECAYTILECERGEHSREWLLESFDKNQRKRIEHHIRFAEFWYSANGQFSDLKEHCQEIAQQNGMKLTPQEAWQWISQGGFASDIPGKALVAGFFDIASAMRCTEIFTDGQIVWQCNDKNHFELQLDGAEQTQIPVYKDGRILAIDCYVRDGYRLPETGITALAIAALRRSPDIQTIIGIVLEALKKQLPAREHRFGLNFALQALEAMVSEKWVVATLDPTRPKLKIRAGQNSHHIRFQTEN